MEHRSDIHQHAHTNQEVGNEDGVADKLDTVHQRRGVGHKTIKHQTCKEGAKDALQATELSGGSGKEDHSQRESELYDGIAVFTEEHTNEAWQQEEHAEDEKGKLQAEEDPEPNVVAAFQRARDTCQKDEGGKERDHRGSNGDGDRGRLAQSVASNDGVSHQRVGSKDAGQEQGGRKTVIQEVVACQETETKRNHGSDETKDETLGAVLLQVLQVHLQTCQEHNEINAHLTKQFKGGIACQ